MALFDGILKKKYTATVYCNNCNSHSEVQIPRGVTVNQFIENGPCPACGCATLIADYKQIQEFYKPYESDQNQKQKSAQRPRMRFMRRRPEPVQPAVRAPLPKERPSTKHLNYQPLPQSEINLEPQRIFKQPPVDFWTGKPINDDEEQEEIDKMDRRERRRRRNEDR